MDKISPDSPQYVYEQLAAIIERKIRSGEYPPGTRLPGELTMTHEHKVGPGTVRRALDILRDRGLVVTVRARGSFVSDPLPPAPGAPAPSA
ncbi:GntR family transcriptional regulator [Streptomyces sp. NBC_00199]|uniref:GntR family transcriptional regulator n=1 Tax=Streptomyces sp. NBC_00199 TaxID=2975678 RepID=UPI0022561CB8|nr:winged helix-turn-helix domain-containing protein [Streptomyces sp. NBC_00199]MCX5263661.1 winged helix-turn-helix domain-containing protein [Streptomyces sp. NBC_00199]